MKRSHLIYERKDIRTIDADSFFRCGMYVCACSCTDLHLFVCKWNPGRFVKISAASLKESHPHDIHITKEAPNYSTDE